MRRATRRKVSVDPNVKKITIKRLQKRNAFVVQYADGRRVETPYIEVMGPATLYLDSSTKEPVIRTDANISLSPGAGVCTVCGADTDDQHAHA
jgi:hypothetical protein